MSSPLQRPLQSHRNHYLLADYYLDQLNERVYALFDLTPTEIKLIEDSTKYRYDEV